MNKTVVCLKIFTIMYLCVGGVVLPQAKTMLMTGNRMAPQVAEQYVADLPLKFNLVVLSEHMMGAIIPIKIFVKNVSNMDFQLEVARNVPEYDITIQDSQGKIVWSCDANLQTVRLAMNEVLFLKPNQAFEQRCVWDQTGQSKAGVGEYVIGGTFVINERLLKSVSRRIIIR